MTTKLILTNLCKRLKFNCWSLLKKEPIKKGLKTVYRCNHVSRRAKQCSAGIYTITNQSPEDQSVSVFRKNLPHDHENNEMKKPEPLSNEVKQRIIDLYKDRSTPKAILYKLQNDENMPHVSINQVYNVTKAYKRKEFGESGVTLNGLTDFVHRKMGVPEDPDEAFVISFDRPGQDDDDNPWFRMFVSTKRLLRLSSLAKNIHSDGTYKITIEGHPILNVGASDMGGHLFGMMLSCGETTEDYHFLFQSLRFGVERIVKEKMDVSVLIADATMALTKSSVILIPTPSCAIFTSFSISINENLSMRPQTKVKSVMTFNIYTTFSQRTQDVKKW